MTDSSTEPRTAAENALICHLSSVICHPRSGRHL
jgi:hypothetical protein